jgi:A/G-specific adenine glycosylase
MSSLVLDIEDIAKRFHSENQKSNLSEGDKLCCVSSLITDELVRQLQFSITEWYQITRRKMPWRGDFTTVPVTAYSIWVSEVMLQQTRVETVVSYWTKWMLKYPTISDLAKASPDEVNTLWSGLGYYRRAQNLLKGAQYIMEKHGGVLPSVKKDLLEVPGIGPYTAGAILSIAYHQQEPLVDGNVIRLFSRLFSLCDEFGSSGNPLEKKCWKIADKLMMNAAEAGHFNQGLMEIGSTICKPSSPDCDRCPVQLFCQAKALVDYRKHKVKSRSFQGDFLSLPEEVSYFPRKQPKKKQKEINLLIYVVAERCTNHLQGDPFRYLLFKRPPKGLLANQWEFPAIFVDQLRITPTETGNEVGELLLEVFPKASQLVANNSSFISHYFLNKCQSSFIGSTSKSDYVESEVSQLFESVRKVSAEEPVVHIFSHEIHRMFVHIDVVKVISIGGDRCDQPYVSGDVCWKTMSEMKAMGITTGCKKILEEVESLLCEFKETNSESQLNPFENFRSDSADDENNVFLKMKRAAAVTLRVPVKKRTKKG